MARKKSKPEVKTAPPESVYKDHPLLQRRVIPGPSAQKARVEAIGQARRGDNVFQISATVELTCYADELPDALDLAKALVLEKVNESAGDMSTGVDALAGQPHPAAIKRARGLISKNGTNG